MMVHFLFSPRDNVLFVLDKLNAVESMQKVVELALNRLSGSEHVPPEMLKDLQKQMVVCRRTAGRIRMKYDPLLKLLKGLGGGADVVKMEASMLRKGILGAAMALGTLANMLRKHMERGMQRLIQAQEQATASIAQAQGQAQSIMDQAQTQAQQQTEALATKAQNAQRQTEAMVQNAQRQTEALVSQSQQQAQQSEAMAQNAGLKLPGVEYKRYE